MPWVTPSWWLVLLAGLLLLQLVLWWWRRWWVRWRAQAQSRRASRAERRAASLLERAGYVIEASQPKVSWPMLVDGECRQVALRADYLVWRDEQRYVAEVKSGRLAPRLSTASTRRQLLEYALAYDVVGVLLVDMAAKRIVEVGFPDVTPPARCALPADSSRRP